METFRVSVIDFIPHRGRIKTGEKDSSGKEICLGDVVSYGDEKYMVVYRYGAFALKQPMTMHALSITDWCSTTVEQELWSTPDYLVCAAGSDQIVKKIKMVMIG